MANHGYLVACFQLCKASSTIFPDNIESIYIQLWVVPFKHGKKFSGLCVNLFQLTFQFTMFKLYLTTGTAKVFNNGCYFIDRVELAMGSSDHWYCFRPHSPHHIDFNFQFFAHFILSFVAVAIAATVAVVIVVVVVLVVVVVVLKVEVLVLILLNKPTKS